MFIVRMFRLMLVFSCSVCVFLLVVFSVMNSGSRCLLVGCVCLVNGVCWW